VFEIGWATPETAVSKAPSGRPVKPREARRRTCLSGKLVYGDGTASGQDIFTVDCSIHDLSGGGAKIKLAQRRPLPSSLYLIITKFCIAYRAELAWMNYPSRGLRFCTTYRLESPLPEDAQFLRKLWEDLYARDGGLLQPGYA
jgi:hypothetical protein